MYQKKQLWTCLPHDDRPAAAHLLVGQLLQVENLWLVIRRVDRRAIDQHHVSRIFDDVFRIGCVPDALHRERITVCRDKVRHASKQQVGFFRITASDIEIIAISIGVAVDRIDICTQLNRAVVGIIAGFYLFVVGIATWEYTGEPLVFLMDGIRGFFTILFGFIVYNTKKSN